MNHEIFGSAKKVQDFLIAHNFDCVVKMLLDTTRTAEEAAKAIGCSVAQIAKSLVFMDKDSGNPILIIASGINQVDLKKMENATGLKLIKADGKVVKERIGFAIGGVPPVAHNEKIATYLDPTLLNYDFIWAAAGTPFAVFQLKSNELQKMTGGNFIDLKTE